MIIKWTNKYSGETGYVASVSHKEGHFVSTDDINKAKSYSSKTISNIIKDLIEYGEGENNNFEIVE